MRRASLVHLSVALTGPLAIILIRLLGQGPGQADAAPDAAIEPVTQQQIEDLVFTEPDLIDAWIASHARASARETTGTEPTADGGNDPTPPDPDTPVLVFPRVWLSAILGGAERGAAVLNTQIYWVGDTVVDEWTLHGVDPIHRTVTLRHSSGVIRVIEFIDDE